MVFLQYNKHVTCIHEPNDDHHNDSSKWTTRRRRWWSEWGEMTTVTSGSGSGDDDDSSHLTEVHWQVPMIFALIEGGLPLVLSPKFYVSQPGFRLQLMIVPNSTYTDSSSHLGVFFRLVTGIYDSDIHWPYQFRTEISVLDQDPNGKNFSFPVIPNRDPCRLRSAFLRPSTDTDNTPRPDGCGSRRLMPLGLLKDSATGQMSTHVVNGSSIIIKCLVDLRDLGTPYDTAKLTTKYNGMVSEYIWSIHDFPRIQKQSINTEAVAVLSSEPFYSHGSGYLFQMFLTLLPSKRAFAISTALLQGDFDRWVDTQQTILTMIAFFMWK